VLALGLAQSRSQAQGLIRAGRVLVDDRPVDKPGTRVTETAEIRVRGGGRRFVSRGGDKLAGALEDLRFDPAGSRVLDVGASTGGFTDCLLQAGAAHVTAVDVGYGQLDLRLREDPRVHVLERTNARHLAADALPGPVDLVVVDVSFISSTLVLPRIVERCPEAQILVMVKPQFELGRERVGKGGVVREDADRALAVERVAEAGALLGLREVGRAESRLPGPKGNREVFLWLRPADEPA
jgi:23S rRNA (cytidine1920-2'-O)/16S rRNA (cytidine1409-2'-O)-methyltransferase